MLVRQGASSNLFGVHPKEASDLAKATLSIPCTRSSTSTLSLSLSMWGHCPLFEIQIEQVLKAVKLEVGAAEDQ